MNQKHREYSARLIDEALHALSDCVTPEAGRLLGFVCLDHGCARTVLEAFMDKVLTCEVCGKTGLQGGEECVCGGPL
jgi:hypothetical protein